MKKHYVYLYLLAATLLFCAQAQAQRASTHKKHTRTQKAKKNTVKYGIASYYDQKFHGNKTANGNIYRHQDYTAASNSFPLNTWIRVTNLRNHNTVIVKINDRLHKKNKRLVDLSKRAAEKLDFISLGIVRVKVEVLRNFKPPKSLR